MSSTDDVKKPGMSKPVAKPSAPSSQGTKNSNPAGRTFSPNPPNPTFVPPTAASAPAKPVAIPMAEVVSKIEKLAKASPIELNWKVSIHDLMALLGMAHSAAAIEALAVKLGCPESEMGDSYKRNVWAHKALLTKIAENGGDVPKELLG